MKILLTVGSLRNGEHNTWNDKLWRGRDAMDSFDTLLLEHLLSVPNATIVYKFLDFKQNRSSLNVNSKCTTDIRNFTICSSYKSLYLLFSNATLILSNQTFLSIKYQPVKLFDYRYKAFYGCYISCRRIFCQQTASQAIVFARTRRTWTLVR